MNYKLIACGLLFVLVACGQTPQEAPPLSPSVGAARPLGNMSLEMYIGEERNREVAVPAAAAVPQNLAAVRTQGFPAGSDVTLSQATYTMRVLGNPERWTFTASFRVTNNSSQALNNLTFVARARSGASLGETALSRIQGQNGSLTTDPALARQFEGINTINSSETVIESAADFQALRRTEAAQFESLGRSAGALPANDTLLNYGFVARKSNTSRIIPSVGCKTSPTDQCNVGTVSITFKTPAFPYTGPGSIPSLPLRLTFEALLLSDGPNRVTRSEETTAAALQRAQSFAASEVALIGGDTDTAAPKQTVRIPFVGSFDTKLSADALTSVEALPKFQALNAVIDRDYVVGTTTNGKTLLWFPDQSNTWLFFSLIDGTRVEQLLRFKPVGNGFEAVNILDGRGFAATEFASLLDASNEIGDTAAGFALQAKFAQLLVKNPDRFEFPQIKLTATSGLVRPQGGGIPPITLVDLSCAACVDQATVLIRDAGLFFTGLVSGGVAVSTAARSGFFITLISTGSVKAAMAALGKQIFRVGGEAAYSAISTWSGYDSVVSAAAAYYACIAAKCPPLLRVNPSTLEANGRLGGMANVVFIIQAASASGFVYSGTATRGTVTDIPFEPPIDQLYLPLIPNVPGVLYGNQARGAQYKAQCPNSPVTFTDRITYTYQGKTLLVDVTVRCSGALLEPPPPGELKLATGTSVEGARSFRNIGSAPLTYSVTSTSANMQIIAGASGTVAPGATGSLTLRFTCPAPFGFSEQYFLEFTSNGGNARVPVQLTCASLTVAAVTTMNGPLDGCARVKVFVTLTDPSFAPGTFEVLIDGQRSNFLQAIQTGPASFQLNLTRGCNLSVGRHVLSIRYRETASGFSYARTGDDFSVADNRWPGVAVNDTNRCAGASGVTLALIRSQAPGEPDQEARNVLPGRAAQFNQKFNVTYSFRGEAANILEYVENVGANYGGAGPVEGNPTVIDGITAYWGVFFVKACLQRADVSTQGADDPASRTISGYFQNLAR